MNIITNIAMGIFFISLIIYIFSRLISDDHYIGNVALGSIPIFILSLIKGIIITLEYISKGYIFILLIVFIIKIAIFIFFIIHNMAFLKEYTKYFGFGYRDIPYYYDEKKAIAFVVKISVLKYIFINIITICLMNYIFYHFFAIDPNIALKNNIIIAIISVFIVFIIDYFCYFSYYTLKKKKSLSHLKYYGPVISTIRSYIGRLHKKYNWKW